jgi:hypothetical protein
MIRWFGMQTGKISSREERKGILKELEADIQATVAFFLSTVSDIWALEWPANAARARIETWKRMVEAFKMIEANEALENGYKFQICSDFEDQCRC